MPPGAKKRKANKKKKGNVPNSHSTTNNQQVTENDDLKIHDEKDSDGGEISSPKSQPDQRSLTENEEQGEVGRKDWDSHLSVSVIADSKPMEASQNGTSNGEVESKQREVPEELEVQDIEVIGGLKPEEGEIVRDIQVTRELKPDGDSESKGASIESVERDAGSSSSISSSDDESPLADQNSQVMEPGKMVEEEKGGGSVVEIMPDDDSAGELWEKIATSVMETATNVESGEKLEDKKSAGSVMETVPAVDLAEPVVSLTEEVTQAFACSIVVDTGVSNEIGLASKGEEEISVPFLNETAGASNVIDLVAKENEDKMLQPSDTPFIETSGTGGAELPKDHEIPESSLKQPLLGTVSPAVERTSWKSCCGIFDVLKRSNR